MFRLVVQVFAKVRYGWLIVIWLAAKPFVFSQNISEHNNVLKDSVFQKKAAVTLNQIYGFYFAEAKKTLEELKKQYPEHPSVPFLYALMYFWIIDTHHPDKSRDNLFLSYVDTVLTLNTKLLQPNKTVNVERAFFEFSALAFKARLYALRDQYVKATNLCIKALPFFQTGLKFKHRNPVFLFASGMYNYYVKWYGENKPITRPFLYLFPSGNKELGIQEMEKCVADNNLTSTESAVFLIFIYLDENKIAEAIRHGEYLHTRYPHNSFMAVLYEKALILANEYTKAIDLAKKARLAFEKTPHCYTQTVPISKNLWTSQVMQKILYYGAVAIAEQEKNYQLALEWLEKSTKITELLKNGDNGMNALIAFRRGIYHERLHNKQEAIQSYQLALDADNNDEIKKQAEAFLKRLKDNP